jgi:Ni,Fe-hydrogenase III small subunit
VNWFLRGIQAGIRTEDYPASGTDAPLGATPGLPVTTALSNSRDAAELGGRCPTEAIAADGEIALVNRDRCVHCMRCAAGGGKTKMEWRSDFDWAHGATEGEAIEQLSAIFGRSLHVRIVDAGDCGACLNEIAHLNDPLYNAHRLGFFVTPTPRHADVLIVTGPVTRQMKAALQTAYEAMPDPKRVIAAGVCAVNGGIFGPSLMCGGGALDAVPVDVVVPGCPPPPLAILHALLVVCGRKPPARNQAISRGGAS